MAETRGVECPGSTPLCCEVSDFPVVDTPLPDAGDLDDDDDVDRDDYVRFAAAMNGPNQPAGASCADLDFDGDVDLADLDMVCRLFTGP